MSKVIRDMGLAVVYDLRVKGSLHIFYHPKTK